MELYLIRHAQSANNHAYDIGGQREPDPPLTELGHRQAQILASYLATPRHAVDNVHTRRHDRGGFHFTHLYTSLMLRAVVTASYIARAMNLPLHAWTEIHECGGLHGLDPATGEVIGVAGPNRAYFAAAYPHLVLPDTLGERGWWNRERERQEEYLPRAAAVWRDLLARHGGCAGMADSDSAGMADGGDDRVALVTHGGFYRAFMATLFGGTQPLLPSDVGLAVWRIHFGNTAITHLTIAGGTVSICYTNRVEHLPDELLSS